VGREGLQRKSFFAAGRQKRLERKARFFAKQKTRALVLEQAQVLKFSGRFFGSGL
jgi:hypothetical protein